MPGFIAKVAGQHTVVDETARAHGAALVPLRRYGAGRTQQGGGVPARPEAAYMAAERIHVNGGLTVCGRGP